MAKALAKKEKAQVVLPLKDLVYGYIEARDKVAELQEAAKPYKEAKEAIQSEIIKMFKGRGEYSTKIEGASVSLSVRKTAVVVDEAKVIEQLRAAGLDQYISESLNDLFEGVKKQIVADKGTLLEGIEIRETEFISVRENSKEDARKIVTQDFTKIQRS